MNNFTILNRIIVSLLIVAFSFSLSFAENDINKLSSKDREQCEKMEKIKLQIFSNNYESYRYHKISICNRTGVKKYIENNFDSYHSCYSNARVFIIFDKASNKVLGLTKLDFFYYEDSDDFIYNYTEEERNELIEKRIKEGFYLDNPDSREFHNYNTGYLVDIYNEYNMMIYDRSPKYNYNEDKLPYKAIFSKTKPTNLNTVYLKINNCFVEDYYLKGQE